MDRDFRRSWRRNIRSDTPLSPLVDLSELSRFSSCTTQHNFHLAIYLGVRTRHSLFGRSLSLGGSDGLFYYSQQPDYRLQVFCTRPSGFIGFLTKLQSPFFHLLIGYGFIRLLRWGLLAYFVYASYGLMNALANFACEGYGRIRTVFFLTLLFFTLYVFLRRKCFAPKVSQGLREV